MYLYQEYWSNHNHQNNKMHLMRRKIPRGLEPLLEMRKIQANMAEMNHLMNEITIAEENGETHEYTQEWVYLGIRKDGKALNRGHALMHMLTWKDIIILIAHITKASKDGIPPIKIDTDKIWKQILSKLITRLHALKPKT